MQPSLAFYSPFFIYLVVTLGWLFVSLHILRSWHLYQILLLFILFVYCISRIKLSGSFTKCLCAFCVHWLAVNMLTDIIFKNCSLGLSFNTLLELTLLYFIIRAFASCLLWADFLSQMSIVVIFYNVIFLRGSSFPNTLIVSGKSFPCVALNTKTIPDDFTEEMNLLCLCICR